MTDNPTPNEIALLREALIAMGRMIPGVILDDRVSNTFLANLPEEMAHYSLHRSPGQHDGAAGEGLRVLALIDQVEAGHFDVLDAVADKWAADASVQRMANAMASVFEKYASQDIMDRFREKLGALMHLAFVEGAAQGVLQLRAVAKPSTEQARAEGYVLVPRVPTRAMLDAVDMQVVGCCNMDEADARECWTAMLDAAATPSSADALGDGL